MEKDSSKDTKDPQKNNLPYKKWFTTPMNENERNIVKDWIQKQGVVLALDYSKASNFEKA